MKIRMSERPGTAEWGPAGALAAAIILVILVSAPAHGETGPPPPERLEMVLDPGSEKASSVPFRLKEPVPEPEKDPGEPEADAGELTLALGLRQDQINWTIAGSGHSPNIISELDWEDVRSFQASGRYQWHSAGEFYFRSNAAVALAVSGDVRDSDYLGNNRTYEYSRSYSKARDSLFYDLQAGIGYRWQLPFPGQLGRVFLCPLIGVSRHSQNLRMQALTQVVSNYGLAPAPGSYDGLNSTYDALWQGPWLGADLTLVSGRHRLTASLEYHSVDYEAEADWNMRSDLAHPVSYRQEADAWGVLASLIWSCALTDAWDLSLGFQASRFETDAGTITFYAASGGSSQQPFNGATWESLSLNIGLTYHF